MPFSEQGDVVSASGGTQTATSRGKVRKSTPRDTEGLPCMVRLSMAKGIPSGYFQDEFRMSSVLPPKMVEIRQRTRESSSPWRAIAGMPDFTEGLST
jgi:hypothetical protein